MTPLYATSNLFPSNYFRWESAYSNHHQTCPRKNELRSKPTKSKTRTAHASARTPRNSHCCPRQCISKKRVASNEIVYTETNPESYCVIKWGYRREIDKFRRKGQSVVTSVDAVAGNEPSEAENRGNTHGRGKLDCLPIDGRGRGAGVAAGAFPCAQVLVGLASIQAKGESWVGAQVAGLRAVLERNIGILDDERVLLCEERLVRVIGLLGGIPDIFDRSSKRHVAGEGPGGTGGRATSKNIDSRGSALQGGVIPAKGHKVADSIQSSTECRVGRHNHADATERRILGKCSVGRRRGTLCLAVGCGFSRRRGRVLIASGLSGLLDIGCRGAGRCWGGRG